MTGNAIFLILNDKRLSGESRNSLVVEILKRAINFNRFDIALKLWNIYAIIITSNPKTVIPVLVESFQESCAYFEFKAFLFDKLEPFMNEV